MKPRQVNNPTQPLPDEKDMNAYDLANKYSDRNDQVAQMTQGFVKKYLPPQD
jgi:hypothetical protein